MIALNLENQKRMHDFTVEITLQAELELLETADYISIDNPGRARSFVRNLVSHFTKILSAFPESGRVSNGNVRQLSHKGHTCFYTVTKEENQVTILHIVDLSKPLKERNIDLDD